MKRILLLLLAGIIPVLSQYNNGYQQPTYSEYEDFGRYNSNDEQQQEPDYALQQQSFFGSFSNKNNNNDNQHSASISSVIGGSGSYGGLTPPPPPKTPDQVNNVHKYYANGRHAIVPSSLRELEESYIRSLSTGSGQTGKQSYVGPFGENRNQQQHQQRSQQDGVENYSGFIMTKRHYNKNDHIRSSQQQQYWDQFRNQNQAQGAPITYGFPLLNPQVSATNSIDAPFGRKENGKFFDFSQKNIVPNFPDFSDRPPIPQEPDIPPEEDEVEQATRKPPGTYAFHTPPNYTGFSGKPSPTPLASPPPIFDPSFPDPVLQRGFIPSFGPPTKQPFFPLKSGKDTALVHEQEFLHNQIASHDVSTTSPVPVLRPEYPSEKETNRLPDEVSSIAPDSTEKPREGTIYKHISVHVPAEDLDEEVSSPKIIKVAKKPEKHIKVIFIKPPDSPTQKTEVEVPAGPQQKTLVYVLSESGGTRTPIKLVTPTPLKPAPPQVFFLRYTDPHTGASHPTSSSLGGEEERVISRPTPTPPIKQLASPAGPDLDLLRSAPAPVLPTFPSSFSSPASAIAQQLALQTTLTSPTVFTNTKFNNGIITDPTNSKYHGTSPPTSPSTNSLISDHSINNNQIVALKYSNTFPQSSVQQQINSNPFSQNYYSSLYHLYPPPVPAASVPNQNLLSFYYNPNNYQQYRQQLTQPQFYSLDQSKTGSEPTPSSIQGLYTVAPNGNSFSGINFNSLVQNPDGKNPPRSPRNYVMMNYAPTYMPSASGSDPAPVFTSPADLIKSLLGDSYMYYNNIANNNSDFYGNILNRTVQHDQPLLPSTTTPSTTTTTTTTTSTTTTTPAPSHAKSIAQTQAQHHTLPLIYHWKNHQNLTSLAAAVDHSQQQYQPPFALVVGDSSSNGADANNNLNGQFQNGQPVYPHLRPLFPFTSSTTTPKPQARISWAPQTTPPPPPSTTPATVPTTPKQIIHLPVITYAGNSEDNHHQHNFPHITTGNSVSSHFNNLFRNTQHDHHDDHHQNSTGKSRSSRTKIVADSGELSAEYYSQSESSSDETSEVEDSSSAQEGSSGELEIVPIHFEPTRTNVTSESGYKSSIIYVNSKNSKNSNSNNSNNNNNDSKPKSSRTSASSKRGRSSRKRVNPAHVKPGRRLRKVRKPNKSRKNKNKENDEHATNNQAQSSSSNNTS